MADQSAALNADDMVVSMDVVDSKNPAGGEGATQMLVDNGVEETSEVAGMKRLICNPLQIASQLKYSDT